MPTANYVLLERIELNASASSISFTNIPQSGYTDLKIVASTRQTNASIGLKMAINGYSSFSGRVLEGSGSSASSYSMTTQLLAGYNNSSAYTANTFASTEIYIPNYTSTTNKSVSADTVTETNGTTAYSALFADLYTTSSPITTITFTADNSGNIDSGSTFSLYGLAAVGTTPVIAPKASGGNITTDGTYWIHTFNSTGTFTPLQGLSCDYLVVAGGGGGGYDIGGGGGAGGFRTATGLSVIAQAYTITVGAGGAGGTGGANGSNGTVSTFSTISSSGGGGGGAYNLNGASGGSGGGGGSTSSTQKTAGSGNAGSYSPVEGYAGGNGYGSSSVYAAGGGGGASAVGSVGTSGTGGAGGAGTANSYSGSSITYSTGGTGWGGTTSGSPTDATVNTGNGGMGGKANSVGGKGGSGIVIVRYLVA